MIYWDVYQGWGLGILVEILLRIGFPKLLRNSFRKEYQYLSNSESTNTGMIFRELIISAAFLGLSKATLKKIVSFRKYGSDPNLNYFGQFRAIHWRQWNTSCKKAQKRSMQSSSEFLYCLHCGQRGKRPFIHQINVFFYWALGLMFGVLDTSSVWPLRITEYLSGLQIVLWSSDVLVSDICSSC